jgi:diguanylate cyclase (GGDEF)-like protein
MIDIDHFKLLNDTHGHPAGDEVLKQVASLLRGAVRKVDTVARYGGEEFMVLLPRSERDEALEVAEKLRLLIAQTDFPHAAQQPGCRITVSVGVASFQRDGESIEALIDAADAALYASKRAGRNRVSLYEPGMEAQPGRDSVAGQARAAASGTLAAGPKSAS